MKSAYVSLAPDGTTRFCLLRHANPQKAPRKAPRNQTRDSEVVAAFIDGQTLEKIGTRHGVSRERVRQIIAAANVPAGVGGLAARRRIAQQRRAQEADRKCLLRYGCDVSSFATIPERARLAYLSQRGSAADRGIQFLMSLWVWWQTWRKSGRWNQRGRRGYVMARIGDTGPYEEGNVYICTSSQNIKDGFINRARNRSQP